MQQKRSCATRRGFSVDNGKSHHVICAKVQMPADISLSIVWQPGPITDGSLVSARARFVPRIARTVSFMLYPPGKSETHRIAGIIYLELPRHQGHSIKHHNFSSGV